MTSRNFSPDAPPFIPTSPLTARAKRAIYKESLRREEQQRKLENSLLRLERKEKIRQYREKVAKREPVRPPTRIIDIFYDYEVMMLICDADKDIVLLAPFSMNEAGDILTATDGVIRFNKVSPLTDMWLLTVSTDEETGKFIAFTPAINKLFAAAEIADGE